MTFSLFVLAENVPGGTQIFNLAALAVFSMKAVVLWRYALPMAANA